MTKHVIPPPPCVTSDSDQVLSTLRLVSVRLGLIRAEINDIGIALKNGRIPPEYARALPTRLHRAASKCAPYLGTAFNERQ